jgi:hypothetical protein
MTEQELRALVRDVIARQGAGRFSEPSMTPVASARMHASHATFSVPAGAEGEGLCIIEPAVTCNHCGYCKSLGH